VDDYGETLSFKTYRSSKQSRNDMNINKSIEELESDYWKEIDYPTNLVKRSHGIRRKKLKDLNAGDLRIVIIQNIGLQYAIPLAINILKEDILTDADFYPGDLLLSMIKVGEEFWKDHIQLRIELVALIRSKQATIEQFEEIDDHIRKKLLDECRHFLSL
jgi:hypothetical protein